MRKQFKEENSSKNSYVKINEYISIQRYKKRSKIIISIINEPLISIPCSEFPSFECFLQEVNDNFIQRERTTEDNKLQLVFQKLVLSLNIWAKNNYDTHLLHHKIAFPLLKKLRDVGPTKFQIIFQQEILKMYSTDLSEVKDYLKQEGYINLIGDFF